MQVALHSTWFHGLIVALVIADALIVIFELLLDVGAFGTYLYTYYNIYIMSKHTPYHVTPIISRFAPPPIKGICSARERHCLNRKRGATMRTPNTAGPRPS